MLVIQKSIEIRDIDCEGIASIEVREDDGAKRAYIYLDTGEKLANFHNREELVNLIDALQATCKALD